MRAASCAKSSFVLSRAVRPTSPAQRAARAARPSSASSPSLIAQTPASSKLDIERRRLPRASKCVSAIFVISSWIQIIGTRAKPSSPELRSRPRVRARVTRLVFPALDVVCTRVAPFTRARSATSHTEGSKTTCTRKFPGTYQKTLVQNCLPIRNAWYNGTVVRKRGLRR